jgi:ABC-type glycerol-3-phosphate transport system permease component
MKKRLSRSVGGDITLIICLMLLAVVMLLPIVYAVVTSLKPNNELWIFPPRFFVRNPTTKNYSGLFELMNTSWVPFSRYFFNTLFITVVGSIGHIMIATMCAYPLACYRFPGSRFIFKLIQTSLMFSASVTAIPTFIVMSKLHLVDNYLALILPAFALPLGLFLMKQFIEQMVHPALLESAELDGASEFIKCFKIVFPMVKPAWLTLAIFSVQTLWTVGNTPYIYTENKKTLNYAMSQIVSAGIARQGVGAAVSVVMLLVPLLFFIISQSNIVETMGSSGIKD